MMSFRFQCTNPTPPPPLPPPNFPRTPFLPLKPLRARKYRPLALRCKMFNGNMETLIQVSPHSPAFICTSLGLCSELSLFPERAGRLWGSDYLSHTLEHSYLHTPSFSSPGSRLYLFLIFPLPVCHLSLGSLRKQTHCSLSFDGRQKTTKKNTPS